MEESIGISSLGESLDKTINSASTSVLLRILTILISPST